MKPISLREKQLQFRNEVLRLVETQKPYLTESECKEVMDLVQHNENGEALRTLAYILVEEEKPTSKSVFENIGRKASGLIDREDMPEIVRVYMNE